MEPTTTTVTRIACDHPRMLQILTGLPDWIEEDGPESGCGLDWWYVCSVPGAEGRPVKYRAYVNLDQTWLLLSAIPVDEHGDPGEGDGAESWRIELDVEGVEGTPYAGTVTIESFPHPATP